MSNERSRRERYNRERRERRARERAERAGSTSSSGNAAAPQPASFPGPIEQPASTSQPIVEPAPKRGPGRPRKQPISDAGAISDAPQPQPAGTPFEIVEPAPGPQRPPRPPRVRAPKAPTDEIRATSLAVLAVIDMLAKLYAGREAEMTDEDIDRIEPPLSKVMARMDANMVRLVQHYSAPVELVMAFTTYGARVLAIKQAKTRKPSVQERMSAQPEPPPSEPATNANATPEEVSMSAPPFVMESMRPFEGLNALTG